MPTTTQNPRSFQTLPPDVIQWIILRSLSFNTLNRYADSLNTPKAASSESNDIQTSAETLLHKDYPNYSCPRKEKANNNYAALIDNLVQRVIPRCSKGPLKTPLQNKNEATYRALLKEVGLSIHCFIKKYLYSDHGDHEVNLLFARDLIFHYCQLSPEKAGQLLNKYSLKSWSQTNNQISTLLIEYGADVKAKDPHSLYSTFFNALSFNSSPEMLDLLIDHGADYRSHTEERHGLQYSLMLLCALNRNVLSLEVLIKHYPTEVAATLKSLQEMLRRNEDNFYTCEEGAYKSYSGINKTLKTFYDTRDIAKAIELVVNSYENVLSAAQSTGARTATPKARRNASGFFQSAPLARQPGKAPTLPLSMSQHLGSFHRLAKSVELEKEPLSRAVSCPPALIRR